jgi:hypothetical protein
VFKYMLVDGPVPDAVTVVKVLATCSESGVMRGAFCLHGYLVNTGSCGKMFVVAALVNLYSKCGDLASAVRVSESATEKDFVLWSSLISGYGLHVLGQQAVSTLYHRMVASSVKPNSLSSAIQHAATLELCRKEMSIFKSAASFETPCTTTD